MKRTAAAMVLIVLAGLSTGCSRDGHGRDGGQPPRVVKGVMLQAVKRAAIPEVIEAVGTIRARTTAMLAARIPGTVTAVYAREGDRVAKGKLLVRLEAAETSAGAAGAQAAVVEAERGVDEARARKKLAEATFQRYQRLFTEQAVTRQEYETRQTENELSVQGLALAEARLARAHEGSRGAGALAGYTRITSPIAGVITAKSADVGMTVFPGTQLMTVEEEGRYWLEAAVPENMRGNVHVGDAVAVVIEGTAADLAGRIAEVVPSVDPATRTFIAKVDVAAKGLRSGMYGRAKFSAGSRQGIMAPKTSVVERGALTSVWVVGGDGAARMRLVKTGRVQGEMVEVLSGLSDGELVVVSAVEKVVDGARIEK